MILYGIKKVVLASDDDIVKTAFNLTNIIFNQYEDKIINHIIKKNKQKNGLYGVLSVDLYVNLDVKGE